MVYIENRKYCTRPKIPEISMHGGQHFGFNETTCNVQQCISLSIISHQSPLYVLN